MSFNTIGKPRLVEPKLSKYFLEKIKEKELKQKMEVDLLEAKQKELDLANQPAESFFSQISTSFITFMKQNYGFVIIITLMSILLYVRYLEVIKRKEKLKQLIDDEKLKELTEE